MQDFYHIGYNSNTWCIRIGINAIGYVERCLLVYLFCLLSYYFMPPIELSFTDDQACGGRTPNLFYSAGFAASTYYNAIELDVLLEQWERSKKTLMGFRE
jgi:hypothetical protein